MTTLNESTVEESALAWLRSLGWQTAYGPDVAHDGVAPERAGYREVVLAQRLRERIGAAQPRTARRGVGRRLPQADPARRSDELEPRNRVFHRMLVDGVTVERRTESDGAVRGAQARVVDFEDAEANDWLAVNQFTVTESQQYAAPRRCALSQRPPAGRHRAEEPRRRGRHDLDGLAPTPDLQGGVAVALRLQRTARGLGRPRGAHRNAHGRQGVVQAVAHRHRRVPGRPRHVGVAGARWRESACRSGSCNSFATSSCSRTTAAARWSRKWPAITSTTRCGSRSRRRCAPSSCKDGGAGARRGAGRLHVREDAGRLTGRPAHRGRLAHAGLRQEPDDGLLRRRRHPRACHGEPDHRRADRPQRPGRPALHDVLPLPRPAAPAAHPGGEARRPARQAVGRVRRRYLHHHPEVLP